MSIIQLLSRNLKQRRHYFSFLRIYSNYLAYDILFLNLLQRSYQIYAIATGGIFTRP